MSTSTSRAERVRKLLLDRANRLGLSFEQLAERDRATERYAQGATGSSIPPRTLLSLLSEAISTAMASPYPTAACLLPFEAEDFARCVSEGRPVPGDISSHIEACPFCSSVVRPDQRSGEFLTHLGTILKGKSSSSVKRSTFSDWLSNSEWTLEQLNTWLVDGPATRNPSDPESDVKALLKSVVESVDSEKLQQELARRLAELLSTDINFCAQSEDEYAFVDSSLISRAFELATEIVPNDQLFDALWNIHERRLSLVEHLSLKNALRRALISQQTDRRLLSELEQTIEQQGHPGLEGEPIEAYEGILALYNHRYPEDANKELLCKELGVIANYLEAHYNPSRRQRFGQLLSSSMRQLSWPPDTWELVMLAHRFGWPKWAVQCLPNLFAIKLPLECTGPAEIIAWQPLAYFILNQTPSAQIEPLCHGEVIRISLHDVKFDILQDLGAFLDSERSRYAYQSSRACTVTATETLRHFVSDRYPDLGPSVNVASYRVLKEANIGAALPNAVVA